MCFENKKRMNGKETPKERFEKYTGLRNVGRGQDTRDEEG